MSVVAHQGPVHRPPPPFPVTLRGDPGGGGARPWGARVAPSSACSGSLGGRASTPVLPPTSAVGGRGFAIPLLRLRQLGEGTCSTSPPPLLSALFSSPSPCCGCSSGGEGICHPPGADAAVGGGDLQHLPAPPAPPPSLCCGCSSGGGYGGGGCGQPASPAAPRAPCCPVRPVRPAALLPCAAVGEE
ncbi:unnamed protein product [Closterium sp. Naga37s-1]|nr:unnamed protein product [Closterium sp. Naga37s-1]